MQRHLSEAGASVRWVRPELLHVTLKFLGEIPDEAAARVATLAAERARGIPPFQLRLYGLGLLPGPRRPRVLMVRVEPVPQELLRLSTAVDDAFGELGVEAERRPFRAHVTLGRFKSPRGLGELLQAMADYAGVTLGTVTVDRIACYASRLSPAGPSYTAFARPPLLGAPAPP